MVACCDHPCPAVPLTNESHQFIMYMTSHKSKGQLKTSNLPTIHPFLDRHQHPQVEVHLHYHTAC